MGVISNTGPGVASAAVVLASPVPPPETRKTGVSHAAPKAPEISKETPSAEEVLQQTASVSGDMKPVIAKNIPRLRIDSESRQVIAQIVDENRQVVKQIPREELLRISANFRRLNGLLFDQKA